MGLGQYNSLGEYCGPPALTAPSVFLINTNINTIITYINTIINMSDSCFLVFKISLFQPQLGVVGVVILTDTTHSYRLLILVLPSMVNGP